MTGEMTRPFVSKVELSINDNNMIDASYMPVHVHGEVLQYRLMSIWKIQFNGRKYTKV